MKDGWAGLKQWERVIVLAAILPFAVGVLSIVLGNYFLGGALSLMMAAAVYRMLHDGRERFRARSSVGADLGT